MAPSALPVPNSTEPFWRTQLHPLDNHRSTPELPAKVDIAIVGSGYAGASVVYHILKTCKDTGAAPPSIAILEAREACSGATGRNGQFGLGIQFQLLSPKNEELFADKKSQAVISSQTHTTGRRL